jgi:hypothetical protein
MVSFLFEPHYEVPNGAMVGDYPAQPGVLYGIIARRAQEVVLSTRVAYA